MYIPPSFRIDDARKLAFEVRVTRVEGKFKLGQNRSAEDLVGVYGALATSRRPGDRELANLMVSEGLAPNSSSSPTSGQ